tara:strand:+ start:2599 stop:3132 length:534 start_codon:yes stop_codon:yes gene_type:complete
MKDSILETLICALEAGEMSEREVGQTLQAVIARLSMVDAIVAHTKDGKPPALVLLSVEETEAGGVATRAVHSRGGEPADKQEVFDSLKGSLLAFLGLLRMAGTEDSVASAFRILFSLAASVLRDQLRRNGPNDVDLIALAEMMGHAIAASDQSGVAVEASDRILKLVADEKGGRDAN